MGICFGGYVFDPARRELRRAGEIVPAQPQVFDLIGYLLERRERVVTKEELLDALWPDAEVTEGSLQRTVSLARAALADGGEVIRTYPRRGYRFVAAIEAAAAAGAEGAAPPPRYVRRGDVHLAAHDRIYVAERDALRPAVEASAAALAWPCRVVPGCDHYDLALRGTALPLVAEAVVRAAA